MQLNEVDVYDPDNYVEAVPHDVRHPALASARHWHEHPLEDGFWCVTRHADIVQVNRDWETFSNYARSCFMNTPADEDLEQTRLMMLNMDPPEHHQLRKLVNRGFTPRRIKGSSTCWTGRRRSSMKSPRRASASSWRRWPRNRCRPSPSSSGFPGVTASASSS